MNPVFAHVLMHNLYMLQEKSSMKTTPINEMAKYANSTWWY